MGGGVSLGAFSGSALTEALKLLLIEGLDDEGRRYTHIELDSMSGASAGAVSLAIMLSCLLNYKRYLAEGEPIPNNKFRLTDIDQDLSDQFGPDWHTRYEKHIEPLRALQLAQKLQEKLWVDKLKMTDLMRLDKFDPVEKDSVSLLDRGLLIELAGDYILNDLDQIKDGESYIISKERFLFACSLTNLIPLVLGNPQDPDDITEPLVGELHKAHASYNHKELRVFDFQLNREQQEQKSRLTKAITIGKNKSFHYQIDQPETWSMISATCLACAAFPFAFEPVVLRRYKYEYKIDTPEALEGGVDIVFEPEFEADSNEYNAPVFQSDYTMKYNKRIDQSVPWQTARRTIKTGAPEEEEESFLFSYIDGGTLNNEPIREAFRLANYLDSRDPAPQTAYDRIVIFVDPIVRTEPIKHNSPSFYKYNVKNRFNRLYIRRNGEWNRLTSYVQKLIQTLRDQGAIKEEHKISTYLSSIKLNYKLTDLIDSSMFPGAFSVDFVETVIEFLRYQDQQNNDDYISTFDVNDRQFIHNAIRRYLENRQQDVTADKLVNAFYQLIDVLRRHEQENPSLDLVAEKLNQEIADDHKTLIKKIFYHFILQAVLDADGKDPDAMRMAITPVRYNVMDSDHIIQPETIELPGSEFEAFGGFVNHPARAFSNEYGRYCAYQALSRGDFRTYFRRIMHEGDLPINARLIEHNKQAEKDYKMRLQRLSPLINVSRASDYWVDIKNRIYRLMKLRINKSMSPLFTSWTFGAVLALFLIAIFFPWSIQGYIKFSASLIQFVLFVGLIALGLHLLSIRQKKNLKQSFYFHHLNCLKIFIHCRKEVPKVTHFRYNNQGKYMRVIKEGEARVLPVPYYVSNSDQKILFLSRQKIKKNFQHVFSLLQFDLKPEDTLQSIAFYHLSPFFWNSRKLFEVRGAELQNIEGLDDAEKYISPMIECQSTKEGLIDFILLDHAQPLEDVILSQYMTKSLGLSTV